MSVTRQVTIWCDECGNWEQESATSTVPLRKQLKKKGWVWVRGRCGMQDFCPKCWAKREGKET